MKRTILFLAALVLFSLPGLGPGRSTRPYGLGLLLPGRRGDPGPRG